MQCAHLNGMAQFLQTPHGHHQSLQSRPPGNSEVISKFETHKTR